MFFPRASNKTLRQGKDKSQYFRAPVMEQVLFQDFFQPPSRTSMKSAKVFVKFVKSYLSKVVKEIHFHQTVKHQQCIAMPAVQKDLKSIPLFGIYFFCLEYISSFWNIYFHFCNIFPIFGIYFIFLECISSFWNIFLFLKYISFFLEYISSFWNIFPHQTVMNHAIYRLIQ